MLSLGVRAHDFGKLPADELAARIADQGFCCVQLAVNKAIAGLDLGPGQLTPGLAWKIGQAFARRGLQIAVLGCYINPVHPEPAARAAGLTWFQDHLRVARDCGCGLVATETGSLNADQSFHPDNRSKRAVGMLLAGVEALVETAERFGVTVGLEAATRHVAGTAACLKRVLDAIPSANLRVVLDGVNLLDETNCSRQEQVLREALDLLGPHIAVVHAKDFVSEGGGYRQVRAGGGQFNHRLLLEWLAAHKPGISILLEETAPDTAAASAAFLRGILGG
jgi:L-ribulose-5-phosphate 3-epimerase